VRRFASLPIPAETIWRILETANTAPSFHGTQPWRFVVLPPGESRLRLADAMEDEFRADLRRDGTNEADISKRIQISHTRLIEAPVLILLCADTVLADPYADDKRQRAAYFMLIQSAAAAGMQLLLAAHAEGLGGVWICSPLFTQDAIREALALPPSWEPQAMYYLGNSAATPRPRTARPVQDLVRWL
jgi:coenzyme F420-0:L-glutamate ligase/coenzyme F420-1:gamma-L-glutamate ligase